MEPLIFPLLAFAPGLFWLWFFTRRGVYRPGPRRLLAFTFLLGMVSTIPAGIINSIFLDESILSESTQTSLKSVAVGMLFVVGPAEETCKFMAVRWLAYNSPYFDEPGDGLVYSAAASLGFASLENLFYILTFGPAVMIGRAPLSTAAHVVFGSFWGYALGRQVRADRALPWYRHWQVLAGIAVGAVVHGLFNVSLFILWPAALVLFGLGLSWTLGRFRWARRVSPFRYRRNYPQILCPDCNRRIRIISSFCRFCGASVSASNSVIYCGHCSNSNRPDAGYCTHCGDELLRG